jgi:sugar phosphate isomerase/epimerase
MIARRSFLGTVAAGLFAAPEPSARLKIGVTDWNLRQTGKVDAVSLAKRLGFDGVEISLGRDASGGKLPLDDPAAQRGYVDALKEYGIAAAGTCLDILHVNYLKNDKLALKWIADGIPITKTLNARVMLLPFFGKGALTTRAEMDHVGDALRALAPAAEEAGVILGLENTISAEDNVRIMDRARSTAVLVYYDVGNSTNNGFDPVKEIRWLGARRICQIHLKDNPHYLGEGKIHFPSLMRVIAETGFRGFANLETSSPSKSIEKDMARNLAYVRSLMAEA